MRIAVTGADGTLGSAVLKRLSELQPIPLTQDDLDLSELTQIPTVLSKIKPEIIVHTAAFTAVDESESQRELALRVNGRSVGVIGQVAAKLKALVIYYSTDYVFPGVNPAGYTEDSTVAPVNFYGQSKAEGERRLQSSGAVFIIIRTSRIFGEQGRAAGAKKNFVQKMIELSRQQPIIEVVDDERASPTYAPDLAEATYQLMMSERRGIFHRTNDGSCTWFEFAKEIFSVMKWGGILKPVHGSHFSRPAKRPSISILVNTKLAPLRTWPEALRDYIAQLS
ncbi:MAG: dTDP-4-dehydrorhamnose reductase [Candidatus Kerfeldbacteria bacterium]|nr:dTDP-4-dehydrorhamnose reductase [Candidatus Kerfeldbacteria bacterium]